MSLVRSALPAVLLPLLPCSAAILHTQRRGLAQQRFGGYTRDPFKSFQTKLNRAQQHKHGKQPLESDERAQQKLLLPVNVQSLGQLIATYVPLEKFSRAPLHTRMGLGQRSTAFKEQVASIYAIATIRRKLRKMDPFRPIEFAKKAQEMFTEANAAIQRRDKSTLRLLTTENASESLKKEFDGKRFEWRVEETVERPRVVGARIAPVLTKDNLFGQVVVRLSTLQVLAVYSSAGVLLRGDPSQARHVLDYLVLERHLVKPEPAWRIAGKLPPQRPWRSAREEEEQHSGQKLQTS